jgi:cephalosporin-C deacetylase-like acetyl esterase
MEDFKNTISFLSSLNDVDKERIGVCGISMGGGYMLQLSAFDRRIRAVAIVASGLNLGDTLLEMVLLIFLKNSIRLDKSIMIQEKFNTFLQ